MKIFSRLLLFSALFVGHSVFAQEDCADGVDNDADGLIDLNDPDCDCAGLGGGTTTIDGLIPNPSFEDQSCCPTSVSMLTCADSWIQASTATSDYWHLCGISSYPGLTTAELPLPGEPGGEGYAGFLSIPGWLEYIGTCLSGTMTAGTPYVLNMWINCADGEPNLDLTIFGTDDCADLPWSTSGCPDGIDGWIELGSTTTALAVEGTWYEVTITFTPPVDIDAIAIGGPCVPPAVPGGSTYNYYYVDELTLIDSSTFAAGDITEAGGYCSGDLTLTSAIDTSGWTVQWYLEGIALPGETSETINVNTYGPGTYQVVYTVGSECDESAYTVVVPDDPVADFSVPNVCNPGDAVFTDASTVAGGTITGWDWDFGDGSGTSTDQNPTYGYGTGGSYDVTLEVTSNDGCTDDTTVTVIIYPDPTSDFEFEINGESSADGLTGGCYLNDVFFIDESIVGAPGTITNWDWDFGDGNTSTDENPMHNYDVAGSGPGLYTVTLTVTTADGCQHTFTMDINMTDSPDITIIQNDPSCFGFSDGSFTILVSGGSGGAGTTFTITDASSTIINVGGSNAVNSLQAGTYFYDVVDGGCSATGSVTITDPPTMDIDLSIVDVLCNGDFTGSVTVDTVFNHQGPWEDISYDWSSGPPGGQGITSVTGLPAGQYTLTLTDDLGCAADTTFFINEPPPLTFAEIGYEPAYCRVFDYQVGNGQVYASATGGTPDYGYLWTNLGTGATWIPSTWGALNPGDYEMVVTDANGCTLSQVVTVDSVNPIAVLDITSAQLDGNLSGTAQVCIEVIDTNSLYFANPLNPLADTTFWLSMNYPNEDYFLIQGHDAYYTVYDTCYDQGGEYLVCLKTQNKNGCEDSVCHMITVYDPLEITPPNVFTPDGDGVNDEFTFEFLAKGVQTFHCVIVNRWGVKMAEIHDINTGWNGTDRNGSNCRDGVYFYVYSGTAENGDPFEGQGNIQIINSQP